MTYVEQNDEEVKQDEETDELAPYFRRETQPRILLTTSPKAKVVTLKFAFELHKCIPDSEFLPRKDAAIKKVVKQATERDFTDLIIVHEDHKKPSELFNSFSNLFPTFRRTSGLPSARRPDRLLQDQLAALQQRHQRRGRVHRPLS